MLRFLWFYLDRFSDKHRTIKYTYLYTLGIHDYILSATKILSHRPLGILEIHKPYDLIICLEKEVNTDKAQ